MDISCKKHPAFLILRICVPNTNSLYKTLICYRIKYSLFFPSMSTFVHQISTKMISAPNCLMQEYGITISGSSRQKLQIQWHPGTTILQICPLFSSISRSHICPNRLHSLILITSFFRISENLIFSTLPIMKAKACVTHKLLLLFIICR